MKKDSRVKAVISLDAVEHCRRDKDDRGHKG